MAAAVDMRAALDAGQKKLDELRQTVGYDPSGEPQPWLTIESYIEQLEAVVVGEEAWRVWSRP